MKKSRDYRQHQRESNRGIEGTWYGMVQAIQSRGIQPTYE